MPNNEDHNMLVRMDERTQILKETVDRIEKHIKDSYVTKSSHELLEARVAILSKIVFGFVGLVLTAFGAALVTLVIK